MGNVIMVSLVWIVAIICWPIMRKIQPEASKLYLVYELIICLLVTAVAAIRLSYAWKKLTICIWT